ncbi:hypothetical protein MMC26_001137 [Xylographa opegraphella]|nr:hypothetical protein [Xylographa opegraphella]
MPGSEVLQSDASYNVSVDSTPPPGKAELVLVKRGWRFYGAFASLCVVNLVLALDGTSVSVALPIIAQDLNGTAIQAFWIGTSYLLTSAVVQPTYASLSHIFGRQPLLLTALTLFTLGAIVAGVAHNVATLIAGRCIQGIGGGGIIALSYIIITDMVGLRERGKWIGIVNMSQAVGSVSGPVIGGAFSVDVTWRWIFFVNLPFCGLGFAMVPLFLRLNRVSGDLKYKLRRVDWFGSIIFISSLTSFLIPLTWGGIQYLWSSWHTLVPLCIGAVGLLCFVLYEDFVASEPMFRLGLFSNRTGVLSYLCTSLQGIMIWSMLFYLPLYYEGVKGFSPVMSGVALFPQTFTTGPAAIIGGVLITITGRYRWSLWLGWTLTVLGVGLLALLDINTSKVSWIFLNMVSGLGLGILWPACSFGAQAASSNADLPFAAAMFAFFRVLGQTIGVAIGGLIFQNELQAQLLTYPALAASASALSKDASALVQLLKAMPADSIEKAQIVFCFVKALRTLWISLTAIAALGLFSSFFIKGLTLDRDLDTEQGFRHHHGTKPNRDEERNDSLGALKSPLMTSALEFPSVGQRTPDVDETLDSNDASDAEKLSGAAKTPDAEQAESTEKTPCIEGNPVVAKSPHAQNASGTGTSDMEELRR